MNLDSGCGVVIDRSFYLARLKFGGADLWEGSCSEELERNGLA